jgi:hypothetical protein
VRRAAVLSGALLLAGCGGGQRAVSRAQTTHEYPSPRPAEQTVASASPGAVDAIRSFATTYINWDADTVAAQMRWLADRSTEQAHAAMQLAASQTANDYELRRGGIANTGTVEAIAPLRGHPGQYVVVTREQTSASNTDAYQGLKPAWHVTLAGATRVSGGKWAVNRWQPEN